MNELTGGIVMEPPRSLFSISGVKAFRATREELKRARHLPGYVYTSPEFEEYEKDRIFMRDWLCVGRAEELPNRGDYMTLRIMGEPVLLARGKDGLNAFANVCRHRGAEVALGAGNARGFRCPHHGWTYDLRGDLRDAPCMDDSAVNLAGCALPALRSAVHRGWVFLTFNADPPPLAEVLADFDREFAVFRPEDCRLADKTVIDLDCNWKFAIEHLMDLYHLRAAHRGDGAQTDRGDRGCAAPKLLPRGAYSCFFEAAPTAAGSESLGRMPWLQDRPESLACLGFLAPNLNFAADAGALRHLVTWPLAPNRSRVVLYTLLPAESLGAPGIAEKLSAAVGRQQRAIEEDHGMLRSRQNGVGSRYFDPGPLSKLEGPIHHVINHYLDAMTG